MMKGKELSPVNLPYLHDDLLLNCLARVSRSYYPTLSLVSKRFRSLITSTNLHENRSLIGCTESCLYVYFWFHGSSDPLRWFTLCRRPTRIRNPKPSPNPNSRCFTHCFRLYRKKEKKSSDNIMVSIPTHNFYLPSRSLAVFGSNIYIIGGYINGVPSSRVFFMDCRSHTWHEAPSMRVARKFPLVNVLDGKIYVVEGLTYFESSNSIECFDPKTQTWEDLPIPGAEIRGRFIFKSLAIKGKLYLFGDKNLVYNPKENRWDAVGFWLAYKMYANLMSRNFCVIDNVLYCHRSSRILAWYEFEGISSWRVLKGLSKLPRLPKNSDCVRLVNHGGNIAVLWEENVDGRGEDCLEEKTIWCAEIAVYKRNGNKIYGKVKWCDVVLTIPKSYSYLQFIAATV